MLSDERTLAHAVMEIVPLVMRTIAADIRRSDHASVVSHFPLLRLMAEAPHSLSELAERHAVSLPTMSNSITTLEERGWVVRARSLEDRRRVVVSITPEGEAVLDEAQQYIEGAVAAVLADVPEADRQQLAAGLDVLRGAFAKTAPPPCSRLSTIKHR
jgi:DNA-binding MarR family transcriptional regulator